MTIITQEKHQLLMGRNCNKGKHRFRENNFGICWCVLCGMLGTTNTAPKLEENDKITIC